MERIYIGDGVFVWCDGFNIWLATERDGRQHEVALEPNTLSGLDKYRTKLALDHSAPQYAPNGRLPQ